MRSVAMVVLFALAVCGAVIAADYAPLTLTSPQADESMSSAGEVMIRWETTLGGDIDYSIVYSHDGVLFDRVIATGLHDVYEFAWEPGGQVGLVGWIKVKAYRQGYLLAESAAPVRFIPSNAIIVSKFDQKVFHFVDGKLRDVFVCSTALPQYDLDAGTYKVYLRVPRHWSKLYEVWMDHTLFFHRGYALHATNMIRQLGRPASHGCVRLHPKDAKKLYDQVPVGTPVIVLPKTQDCSALLSLKEEGRAEQRQASAR